MVLWSALFSGLQFYTLSKTLTACRDMQLRFLKVKTLLNNAFKHGYYAIFKKNVSTKYSWKIYFLQKIDSHLSRINSTELLHIQDVMNKE